MIFNKKAGNFLYSVIDQWAIEGVVSQEAAARLRESISIRPFDWKKLAKYSFWVAIICCVIAIGSIFTDRRLLTLLMSIFSMSDIMRCLILAMFAAGTFYTGLLRRQKYPLRVFSTEGIFFVGVLLWAGSIFFLERALDNVHASLLFLVAAFTYGLLGLKLSSRLIWAFSLLALGSWFGTETGYRSGRGAYFLGMNYPMRFVLFGGVLTWVSFGFKKLRGLDTFSHTTYVFGLLYLFIALWILSIFGNYSDVHSWYAVRQMELFHWGLLFALVAIGAIVYGLRYDDYTSRAFGITFLFINLYTKYFEYFWDAVHKVVFFLILAASFWVIGGRAEKIWTLEFLKADTLAPEATKSKPGGDAP